MIRFPVRSISQVILYTSKLSKIYPKLAVFFSESAETHQPNLKNKKKKQKNQYYMPIRPLKKQLTTLFGDKQYLYKDKLPKQFNVLPYFLPTFAVLVHNFLMGWSIISSVGLAGALVAGGYLLQAPMQGSIRRALKLQVSKDMSYYFLTVVGSYKVSRIKQIYPQISKVQYQNFGIVNPQDLKDYQPTEEQKSTLTPQQIQEKQKKHVQNNLKNILAFNLKCMKVARLKIKKEDIEFGLSNNILGDIDQLQNSIAKQGQPTTKQLLSNISRYLIIKTNFYCNRTKTQQAYFAIDLQANGQMKYQDYLIALGKNYQIKQQ